MRNIFTAQVRTYLYGVVSSALPLLVTAGFLAPADVQQWLLLAAALLGLGSNVMAVANVKQPETVVVDSASIPLFVQK